MVYNKLINITLVILIVLFEPTHSKVAQGDLDTDRAFHYLTKFCYAAHPPIPAFEYTIYLANKSSDPRFAVYTDSAWKEVYKKDSTCNEKLTKSFFNKPIMSGIEERIGGLEEGHAKYYYFAVIDCKSDTGIDLHNYTIHMTNPGGPWDTEFSYDEAGMIYVYLIFWLTYMVGITVHAYGAWKLYKLGAFHPIVKLLSTALLLQQFSLLCHFVHYAVYASNGQGAPGLKGFGDLLHIAAIIVLMFLSILIAKGWAITSNYLTQRNIIIVVLANLVIAYLALFIWDVVGRDPASTIYFYDSVPGIIVLILRVATMGWFLWCIYHTYKLESIPEKRRFYIFFTVGFSVWYLSLIFYVILAEAINSSFPKKITIVDSLVICSNTLVLGFLNYLLWPTRAEQYFSIKPIKNLLSDERPRSYGGQDGGSLISDDNL